FCAEAFGLPYDFNSPNDGGRVEPFSGFYHPGAPKPKKGQAKPAQSTSITSRLLTRVSINRSRATAEDAMLYALEVLDETQGKIQPGKQPTQTQFNSSIEVANDKLAKDLTAYINAQRFRLGGSGSRGLGKAHIKASSNTSKSSVSQRIDSFNKQLHKRWRDWNRSFGDLAPALPENREYFTLDLQSDAIFTERWRSTTVLTPAMLLAETGIADDSLQLEVAHSSYAYTSGWNSAWGLMKDVDVVTNKGGCYLFSTEQPELWKPVWQRLEARGLGDRTPEGFGQVLICHPFHTVFREAAL
ncbi:MAG: CRISPR-associated RAMP protein Csx10, partial [Synechococcales cyanobacterium RM1_1_8]|nr:CRISPR-associated RAMP protein Csx10 [Synechococcales cyanobacterium RM1_1_8]